jgi:hypothetical protein
MGIAEAAARGLDRIAGPAGELAGLLAAPLAFAGARLRGDRLFHARGAVHAATAEPLVDLGPAAALAQRLAGPAIVRFSSTFWRAREWPDLLGVAVRLGAPHAPQDLVLATVRRPWTFPWAIATTRWRDFLRNDYYAVARYEARGLGHLEVRARAEDGARHLAAGRGARLAESARAGTASLRLEVRRIGERAWIPLVRVRLGPPRADAARLRFDPFHGGAGLVPRGFVHALRRAVYAASRLGAPLPRRA